MLCSGDRCRPGFYDCIEARRLWGEYRAVPNDKAHQDEIAYRLEAYRAHIADAVLASWGHHRTEGETTEELWERAVKQRLSPTD